MYILSFKTWETSDPSRNSSENFNFFVVGIFSQILCITFLIDLLPTIIPITHYTKSLQAAFEWDKTVLIAVSVRIIVDGRTNTVPATHGDRRKRNLPDPGNRTVQRNDWLHLEVRVYYYVYQKTAQYIYGHQADGPK